MDTLQKIYARSKSSFTHGFTLAMLIAMTVSCVTGQTTKAENVLFTTATKFWAPQPFAEHPDWLAFNVDSKPVQGLVDQIQQSEHLLLKSRGEAHVTVISPPEFKVLSSHLSIQEIGQIAKNLEIQKTTWQPLCVARGTNSKNPEQKTFYIVIDAPGLLHIRQEILRQFVARGGEAGQFHVSPFYPHITIGFTDRDLFDTDGVIKDTRNCAYDLRTNDGAPITHWNTQGE